MDVETLVAFLLARTEEDEENARRKAGYALAINSPERPVNPQGWRAFDPFRVLADCEALRRLLEVHAHHARWDDGALGDQSRATLEILAAPFSGHPDYPA